jgi:hypothetical protein
VVPVIRTGGTIHAEVPHDRRKFDCRLAFLDFMADTSRSDLRCHRKLFPRNKEAMDNGSRMLREHPLDAEISEALAKATITAQITSLSARSSRAQPDSSERGLDRRARFGAGFLPIRQHTRRAFPLRFQRAKLRGKMMSSWPIAPLDE